MKYLNVNIYDVFILYVGLFKFILEFYDLNWWISNVLNSF